MLNNEEQKKSVKRKKYENFRVYAIVNCVMSKQHFAMLWNFEYKSIEKGLRNLTLFFKFAYK